MTSMRSLLQRALSAAGRRPKLRFLLACPADSAASLAGMLASLRSRLPGCSLDCRGVDEARACSGGYDAVFVVLDKAGQTLPEQLVASLRCEKWRFHLLAPVRQAVVVGGGGAGGCGLAPRRFVDRADLQFQLGDLMYERAIDVQRLPRNFGRRHRRS